MDIRLRIEELQKQLIAYGYYPFQLDAIAREAIGTTDLSGISGEQEKILAETLEDYIKFALKCKSVPSNDGGR